MIYDNKCLDPHSTNDSNSFWTYLARKYVIKNPPNFSRLPYKTFTFELRRIYKYICTCSSQDTLHYSSTIRWCWNFEFISVLELSNKQCVQEDSFQISRRFKSWWSCVEKLDHNIEVEEFKSKHKISSSWQIPNLPHSCGNLCASIFSCWTNPKILKQSDSGNMIWNKLLPLTCKHQSMTAMVPASITGDNKCPVFNGTDSMILFLSRKITYFS